jgi:dGTPase
MNWDKLLSPARFGKQIPDPIEPEFSRSEFQRDYDRIIFSSPFRRLQNKTQVFPLPGSVFVHNRLTHSLEVACVGRSLGNRVSSYLLKNNPGQLLLGEIGSIVSAASLVHDMGNPPFGHAGEKAISDFFVTGAGALFKNPVTPAQWADLNHFEGNANALRLLTHTFNGRRKGGFVLTYATLASMIKYPFSSLDRTKKNKYGYFDTEKEIIIDIADKTGLLPSLKAAGSYFRHPLVYLVEAADDISYQIMDIEDAHKLGIITTQRTTDLLMSFFDQVADKTFIDKKNQIYTEVTDRNELIAFLRASVINHLVNQVAQIFISNEKLILQGQFSGSLVDGLTGASKQALSDCSHVAWNEIYNHRSVIEVEITGYNVLNTLLTEYMGAVFQPKGIYSKKLLAILPLQYQENHSNDYERIRSVLDFVSGMTDLYALDLYKLIKGIGI